MLEKVITLGRKGDGWGFGIPDAQMEALATHFQCSKEEVALRMKGKIWLIFPSEGGAPLFALSLSSGDGEDE